MIHWILLHFGILFDAWLDARLIKAGKDVHTGFQYVIREMAFIGLAIIFSPDNRYALYSWILSHFVYWWAFDTTLNIFRGKPLYYISDRGIDYYQQPHDLWFWIKFFFFAMASAYFFKPELYYL